ncbi:phage protein [Staphylococcus aureus]|uniref:Phage protein n=4 Tax=Staphylococcus TaxID=1279 RepID=A0A380FZY6_9STAP|nr:MULTISPECIES: hypothetical protein [Staphylococcus]EHS77453.1 hypothetical protein IS189_2761 [Staphylococcus aureus subsp. aureus IS-189]AGY90197.1 Hypothetical protein SAZ172_2097 [Staphylococcus aureus subsp. aureus Z172]AID40631.1 hypothetical protein SAXN108_2190 [Staphylococcus aureus]EHM57818.1 hypothetical protein SA21178_2259 [Staphylococcus aureus subsp. aureus 21178]EJE43632.1 hypothetical protein HMPREF1386_11819 [Staphylococcus epidermidis NIH051668]
MLEILEFLSIVIITYEFTGSLMRIIERIKYKEVKYRKRDTYLVLALSVITASIIFIVNFWLYDLDTYLKIVFAVTVIYLFITYVSSFIIQTLDQATESLKDKRMKLQEEYIKALENKYDNLQTRYKALENVFNRLGEVVAEDEKGN